MTKVNDHARADLMLSLAAAVSGCSLGECARKDGYRSASPLVQVVEIVQQTDSVGAEKIAMAVRANLETPLL
jgi:hypothetical protein